MVAAVDLHQHALLWYPLPAHPVLTGNGGCAGCRYAALTRTSDARLGRLRFMPFPFPKQLGQMRVVGSRVLSAGQLHHFCGLGIQDGVVGLAPPVAMSQGRCSGPR